MASEVDVNARKPEDVIEDIDDAGAGIGVERESDATGEAIAEPFDPEQIEVQTRTMTVNLVMSRLETHAINIAPDFQRKAGVWNDVRQSRLIESLLLRIPLPSFYAAENEHEDWEVIDGIQRITSLARFINPEVVNQSPLVLTELEYLEQFDGYNYSHLPGKLRRRLQETEFVFHVIKHGTPAIVKFNIFARINTGGLPLTHQELRHAMVPGRARRVLFDWTQLSSFQDAVDHSIKSDRMYDREMILRFLAFRLTPQSEYRGSDLNGFLLEAMQSINDLSTEELELHKEAFETAMHAARDIFENDAFRKRFRKDAGRMPINKALFDAVSVGLSRMSQEQLNRLIERRTQVVNGFIELMTDSAFVNSISSSTGTQRQVQKRFDDIDRLLNRWAAP